MAAVVEVNSTLASKCMDFCQALASQGQAFNFSIVIGPNFSFSLDTRSKVMQESVTKKRSSPSTLRRNAKRREEFAKKKQHSSVRTTRRCQIKAQFESGVKTKFLAPIFQSMTSISDYQSIPRSHSFQNMYNTYMCKMHLKGEK